MKNLYFETLNKLRLKGDRNIHFDKESNTSYKIDITGEDTLFGLTKFSN